MENFTIKILFDAKSLQNNQVVFSYLQLTNGLKSINREKNDKDKHLSSKPGKYPPSAAEISKENTKDETKSSRFQSKGNKFRKKKLVRKEQSPASFSQGHNRSYIPPAKHIIKLLKTKEQQHVNKILQKQKSRSDHSSRSPSPSPPQNLLKPPSPKRIPLELRISELRTSNHLKNPRKTTGSAIKTESRELQTIRSPENVCLSNKLEPRELGFLAIFGRRESGTEIALLHLPIESAIQNPGSFKDFRDTDHSIETRIYGRDRIWRSHRRSRLEL